MISNTIIALLTLVITSITTGLIAFLIIKRWEKKDNQKNLKNE